MAERLGSIVVPAHDEAAVIEGSLQRALGGFAPGEVEAVVVCNGCRDDTASRARAAGVDVEVIEIDVASKAAALRAGDAAVTTLPRIYLDADVSISTATLRTTFEALSLDGVRSARPPVEFDVSNSSWPVRRYYAARGRLAGVMSDLCAAGVYGLSASGRARFDDFPDLVADDLFVARAVGAEGLRVVDAAPVIVHVPRDARSLVRILTRTYRGNRELAAARPDLATSTATSTLADLATVARSPGGVVDAAVYGGFAVVGRIALALRRAPVRWERDDSSR